MVPLDTPVNSFGAQMIVYDASSLKEGLFENGLDSIRHALDHFTERRITSSRIPHHDKWAVLSVHHAAECICNVLLLELKGPDAFRKPGGSTWFPSLSRTLRELTSEPYLRNLTGAEHLLLELLDRLNDIRHQLMHRTTPETIDVSIAAMVMIGLLKHVEARYGRKGAEETWSESAAANDVVAAIRYSRIHEYGRMIELFLQHKYPGKILAYCPACAVRAVADSVCEACYEEVESMLCPYCDEEVHYLHWQKGQQAECDGCGAKVNLV